MPASLSDLPRKPLSYYLSILCGVPHDPTLPLESYLSLLTYGVVPTPLPKRSIASYLSNFVPSGFRLRINDKGELVLSGESPLPNFQLDLSSGLLTYISNVAGSPPATQISLSPRGEILKDL